jgi:hypothetical protein
MKRFCLPASLPWLLLPLLLPTVQRTIAVQAQPDSGIRAFFSLQGLELPLEEYRGQTYYFLANGALEFDIDCPGRADDSLELLWGSKNDERTAELSVNGKSLPLSSGGYDGFQWYRVERLPDAGSEGYRVRLRAGQGKAAFISAIRLVSGDAASYGLPGGDEPSFNISLRLPLMEDGWPVVEAYTGMAPVLRNGLQARRALRQSDAFVRGWLAKADPVSGLIPENLGNGIDRWNGRNNGADNYAFMVLTAALTDRGLFEGRMLDMLRTEERLTSRLGCLGDYYQFSKQDFEFSEVDLERLIFDNSEYVKDGLMPITEWLGDSPWSVRMSGIIDKIWEVSPVETASGRIPSTNPEVNGEMMQLTSRYFWKTGERRYLDDAIRIADWYLLGSNHPTRDRDTLRLRDHGCELISGLTEVYFACSYADKARRDRYRAPLYEILDCILEHGVDANGMMYNQINPRTGEIQNRGLSDTWGYNYNGFYTVYMVDGVERYRDAVVRVLSNLNQYRGYAWEGRSHDGYADSIESAINLYNREPVQGADEWIDSQMRIMLAMQGEDGIIGGWHGDGNFARTAIMYALWKQHGMTVQPWRSDVVLGAVAENGGVSVLIRADEDWTGRLIFDEPRHQTVMHMPLDYPRINQFPEWFTVHSGGSYRIRQGDGAWTVYSGETLREGLPIELSRQEKILKLVVIQIPEE